MHCPRSVSDSTLSLSCLAPRHEEGGDVLPSARRHMMDGVLRADTSAQLGFPAKGPECSGHSSAIAVVDPLKAATPRVEAPTALAQDQRCAQCDAPQFHHLPSEELVQHCHRRQAHLAAGSRNRRQRGFLQRGRLDVPIPHHSDILWHPQATCLHGPDGQAFRRAKDRCRRPRQAETSLLYP